MIAHITKRHKQTCASWWKCSIHHLESSLAPLPSIPQINLVFDQASGSNYQLLEKQGLRNMLSPQRCTQKSPGVKNL